MMKKVLLPLVGAGVFLLDESLKNYAEENLQPGTEKKLPGRIVLRRVHNQGVGFELLSEGVSCHAMNPEKGKNAIASLLCGMKESGISFSIQHFLDKYDEVFGRTFDGSLLGCAMHDEITGDLTVNVGTICMNGDIIEIKSNVRYPVPNSYDEIIERMIKQLENVGFNI